jgi:hypothetical protein
VRTAEALRALPGVRSVSVDYDTGRATVEGTPLAAESYERAVTTAVAGRRFRGAIEHVADALHIRRHDALAGTGDARRGAAR